MFEVVDVVEPAWVAEPETVDVPDPWDPSYAQACGHDRSDEDSAEILAAWPPPGLLDATAGPDLAALLAEVDLSACSDDAVIATAAGAARLSAWAASVEIAATAALYERVQSWRGVDSPEECQRSSRAVTPERMAASELGFALALSSRNAEARVELAVGMQRLRATGAALAAGVIDWPKARMIYDQTVMIDDAAAAAVETKILAKAGGRTYSELRQSTRRAVIAVDPAAARDQQEQAMADRGVCRQPAEYGMGELIWTDAGEDIEAFWTWLTATAEKSLAPGDPRTLDQARADVLADLGRHGLAFHDLPVRQGRRPHIQVTVSLTTLLGLDDEPGELAGYGPIAADTARRIAGEGTWRRLLTDPYTGRLAELSADTYEPPQELRDHVIARDRTCRAPGCRMPADRCDLDHHIPHPRGPTAASNLGPFCRGFHGVKTHTDTTVHPHDDGSITITLPSGRAYHVPPEPVLDHPYLVHDEDSVAAEEVPHDDVPPF